MQTIDGTDRGLDAEGFIRREGSLDRIGHPFTPVVAELGLRAAAAYPRMNGLYLYGSVPRGTARPGRSDLDALVILESEPDESDRAAADAIAKQLDAAYLAVDGGGILLASREHMLSEASSCRSARSRRERSRRLAGRAVVGGNGP